MVDLHEIVKLLSILHLNLHRTCVGDMIIILAPLLSE